MSNYIFPLAGYTFDNAKVTSAYGYRSAPTSGATTYHQGIDYSAPKGTSVLSAAAGKIINAAYDKNKGYYVQVQHRNGDITEYEHLSKIDALKNAYVSAGEKIGEVGSTGTSTGNHLHFGVIHNGNYVNPTFWGGVSSGSSNQSFPAVDVSGVAGFIDKNFLIILIGLLAVAIIGKVR